MRTLHAEVESRLDLLNQLVKSVIDICDPSRKIPRHNEFSNSTFDFFQNYVHQLMELRFENNPTIVTHCETIFDDSFFKYCSVNDCLHTVKKMNAELNAFIKDILEEYQSIIEKMPLDTNFDRRLKMKAFTCVCCSVSLFCKIKKHYPVPRFENIKTGTPFDPKHHEIASKKSPSANQGVWMFESIGMRDYYNDISFKKSKVTTENNYTKKETPIHVKSEKYDISDKKQLNQIIQPTRPYKNQTINQLFSIMEKFTNHFDTFIIKLVNVPINKTIIINKESVVQTKNFSLQELTINFEQYFKEICQENGLNCEQTLNNDFSDDLMDYVERVPKIKFPKGKGNQNKHSQLFDTMVSWFMQHLTESNETVFDEGTTTAFEKTLFYALLIYKKMKTLQKDRLNIQWIEENLLFEPHLHCAQKRFEHEVDLTYSFGIIDCESNRVLKKAEVFIDPMIKPKLTSKANCLADDKMNIHIENNDTKREQRSSQMGDRINYMTMALQQISFDLAKHLISMYPKKQLQAGQARYELMEILSIDMESTINKISIQQINSSTFYEKIKDISNNNASIQSKTLEIKKIKDKAISLAIEKLHDHIVRTIEKTIGQNNITNRQLKTHIDELCTCAILMYLVLKHSSPKIRLIYAKPGSLFNNRYHQLRNKLDTIDHLEQEIRYVINYGLFNADTGEVLLKSKVKLMK